MDEECPLFEKQETLDLMLSASDFYGDSDIPKNCHGLWCTEYAVSTMGHGGNTNGGSANLVFDKESKTGVVVLTNQQTEMIFCYGIPELLFGSIEDNPIYTNAAITERSDVSGNYIMSRGLFEGMVKIAPCLNYQPLEVSEDPDVYTAVGEPAMIRFGNNLFRVPESNDFFYATTTSDGTTILEYSSMAYIQDDAVEGEFTAVVIFAALVVVTLIMLIVKGIMKLVRKYKAIPAGKAILAGQFARLATGIVLILILVSLVPPAVLVMMCVVAGISAIVCLVSAVFTAKALITEKEMKKSVRVRYVASVLCNLFVTGFVCYFQLFNFWA